MLEELAEGRRGFIVEGIDQLVVLCVVESDEEPVVRDVLDE